MDSRVYLRHRQKADNSVLRSKFESAWLNLISEYKKTAAFQHAQTKGLEREVPVRSLVSENLPKSYRAVGGEVVDIANRASGQLDVIVYNHHRNSAFLAGTSHILPAEAALVTIEVKSLLNKAEMISSLQSVAKLKALKPLNRSLGSPKADGKPFDGKFHYYHCVFAYNTDLSVEDWGQKEFERLTTCANESKVNLDLLDRIYVADRGMLMPSKAIFLEESKTSGLALMQFIIHLRSFCLREDSRRPASDYVNYASSSSRLWKKCVK